MTLTSLVTTSATGVDFGLGLERLSLEELDSSDLFYALHMVDPDLAEVHDLQMRMLAGPLQGDDQDKQSAAQRLLAEVFTHMNGHWTHFQQTFRNEVIHPSNLSTARGKEGAAKKMGLQLGKQIIFLTNLLHQTAPSSVTVLLSLFPFIRRLEALVMDSKTEKTFQEGLALGEQASTDSRTAISKAKSLLLLTLLKNEAPLLWANYSTTLVEQDSFEALLTKLADIVANLERMSHQTSNRREAENVSDLLTDLQTLAARLKDLLTKPEWNVLFGRLEEHDVDHKKRITGLLRVMAERVATTRRELGTS